MRFLLSAHFEVALQKGRDEITTPIRYTIRILTLVMALRPISISRFNNMALSRCTKSTDISTAETQTPSPRMRLSQ